MRIFSFLCLSLLLFISPALLPAQGLEQTNGPEGGTIHCLEKVGNAIWAGTDNGIYETFDEGISWHKYSTIPYKSIGDIYAKGDSFLILADSVIIRSVNGGSMVTIPIPQTGALYFPTFISSKNKIILYSPENSLNIPYISDDFGLTWTPYTSNFTPNTFLQVTDADSFCIAFHYQSGGSQTDVSISTDGFQTWQKLPFSHQSYLDSDIFIQDSVIITRPIPDSNILKRSLDYGKTWTTIITPTKFNYIEQSEFKDTLMAQIASGAWIYSLDWGTSWQPLLTTPKLFKEHIFDRVLGVNHVLRKTWEMKFNGYNRFTYTEFPAKHGIIANASHKVAKLGNRIYTILEIMNTNF